jgi:hypothetical protein
MVWTPGAGGSQAAKDYYEKAVREYKGPSDYEGPSDSDQSQASLDEQLNQIVGKKDKGLSTTGVDPDTSWGKRTGKFNYIRDKILAGEKLTQGEKSIAKQYIGSVPTPYSGAMDRFMKTSPAHAKAYTDKFGGLGKLNLFMATAPEKILSSTLPGKILGSVLNTPKKGLDWLINEKNKEKSGLIGTTLGKGEDIWHDLTGKKTDDGLYTSEADALAAYNAANPDFAPLTKGETTQEVIDRMSVIDFNANAPIYKQMFDKLTTEDGMGDTDAYRKIRQVAGTDNQFPLIIDPTSAAGLDLSGGEQVLPAGSNVFAPQLSNNTGIFNNPGALDQLNLNPAIQDEGIWQEYINKLSDDKGVDFNISEQELEYNKPAWGGNLKFSVNPEQAGVFYDKKFGA